MSNLDIHNIDPGRRSYWCSIRPKRPYNNSSLRSAPVDEEYGSVQCFGGLGMCGSGSGKHLHTTDYLGEMLASAASGAI